MATTTRNTLTSAGRTDAYLLQLSSTTGRHLWSLRFGGSGADSARAVAFHPSEEHVFVVGDFSGDTVFGSDTLESAGMSDAFAAAVSRGGEVLWAKRFGGAMSDSASAVAAVGGTGWILCGHFGGFSTFGLTTCCDGTKDAPNGRRIVRTRGAGSSSCVPCARRVRSFRQSTDVFVTRLDASGAVLWVSRLGGGGSDMCSSVAVDASSDVIVAGHSERSRNLDAFVAKFDGGTGRLLWEQYYGGDASDDDFATGVSVDASGNAVVVGSFVGVLTVQAAGAVDGSALLVTSTNKVSRQFIGRMQLASSASPSQDVFIGKLRGADGKMVWLKSVGGDNPDSGGGVSALKDGDVAVCGSFTGSMLVNGTVELTSTEVEASAVRETSRFARVAADKSDVFVAQLRGDGQ